MVLIAVLIAVSRPFSENLSAYGHTMLCGLIITLSIWIFKPFNLSYSTGGLFLAFFSLAIGLKPDTVFSGFTQQAIWIMIPALLFGHALLKTGLGKRIALAIIKLFKPSYISLVFAWVLIGVALSILTPSTTVRVAIILPIAVQCCELCKLEKGSKGNALILLTAFAMATIPGAGWMTGVLWGPIVQGMINSQPGFDGFVTFNSWLGVVFVPVMISTVLLVVGSLIFMKPKVPLSKDAIDAIKEQPMTKLSRHEAITAIVLCAVFVMFLLSEFHGLPSAMLCLAAAFALFLFGVLETKDFSTGVNWDLSIFVAMTLSLGAIFSETGISAWLAGIVVPAIAPIAGNPWVFMFGIMTIMFLWRFVDVATFVPTIAIMSPLLPAILEAYGSSPLVWPAIFVMAGNAFFMAYQNIWAVMSRSIAGDRAWDSKHMGTYGVIYFVACLLALFVAIPMWVGNGLFG